MPFAAERPALASAALRSSPADFVVEEQLEPGFAVADGPAEHLLLRVGHTLLGTPAAQRCIAAALDVPPVDVGHAGRKDRVARVSQWFSVRLPGRAAALRESPEALSERLVAHDLALYETALATRRLRPGMHGGNAFRITLRPLAGAALPVAAAIEAFNQLARIGVANFFGPQRFDHPAARARIDTDEAPAPPPRPRGRRHSRRTGGQGAGHDYMTVSTVRGWLFNGVLSMRLADPDWRAITSADVPLDVAGPDACPVAVPTGPLWGRGRLPESLAAVESRVAAAWPNLCGWLEHTGVQQDRRAMVLFPLDASMRACADGAVEARFLLPPGGYATSVLRELFELVDLQGEPSGPGRAVDEHDHDLEQRNSN